MPDNPSDREVRNDALIREFRTFAGVKFETLNQAVSGDVVIAEQVHGLGRPGKPLAPIRNLAVYEIRDGKIAAWRDYTNPNQAGQLLGL